MDLTNIDSLVSIITNAGKAVLEVYNYSDFGIEVKKDNSPLTLADLRSNEIIKEGLSKILIDGKNIPLISEEDRNIPYKERSSWDKYWLIDPLDGTKEFIKRNGEFTVNIALIEYGMPAAGFVYIPVQDLLYFGLKDYGSFKLSKASETAGTGIIEVAEKLLVDREISTPVKVVASRSHLTKETEEYIADLKKMFGNVSTVFSGSSIKLCMVADGTADVYPRFAPTMEWDTAAAHAVCCYAGAQVIDYTTNEEMKYNKESLLNNWFLVLSNNKFKEIQ